MSSLSLVRHCSHRKSDDVYSDIPSLDMFGMFDWLQSLLDCWLAYIGIVVSIKLLRMLLRIILVLLILARMPEVVLGSGSKSRQTNITRYTTKSSSNSSSSKSSKCGN